MAAHRSLPTIGHVQLVGADRANSTTLDNRARAGGGRRREAPGGVPQDRDQPSSQENVATPAVVASCTVGDVAPIVLRLLRRRRFLGRQRSVRVEMKVAHGDIEAHQAVWTGPSQASVCGPASHLT